MGERKVLNQYIPPDFDPARVPKGVRKEKNACEVRMMLPMSVQCATCSTFMYKGTKLNSKKEDVVGRDYLGVRIFRFIMKCSSCNAHFSIITDPEHMDFAVEYGVSRNFEPWRQERSEKEADKAARKALEADAVSSLEARTLESKRAMDVMDAIEEIAQSRRRQVGLTMDDLLSTLVENIDEGEVDSDARAKAEAAAEVEARARVEDERAAAAAFAAQRANVKRLDTAPRSSVMSIPRLVPSLRPAPVVRAAPVAPVAVLPAPAAGVKRPRSPHASDAPATVDSSASVAAALPAAAQQERRAIRLVAYDSDGSDGGDASASDAAPKAVDSR